MRQIAKVAVPPFGPHYLSRRHGAAMFADLSYHTSRYAIGGVVVNAADNGAKGHSSSSNNAPALTIHLKCMLPTLPNTKF